MKETVLNDELIISCDEGFQELTEEEISKMNFLAEKPQLCLSDPERHILISAGYKKISGFSAMMLSGRDVAKKSQEQIRRAMGNIPYSEEPLRKISVGNRQGDGFRFEYTLQDTEMSGEFIVLKSGKTLYYISCYYRTALKEDSEAVIREILNSVVWKA